MIQHTHSLMCNYRLACIIISCNTRSHNMRPSYNYATSVTGISLLSRCSSPQKSCSLDNVVFIFSPRIPCMHLVLSVHDAMQILVPDNPVYISDCMITSKLHACLKVFFSFTQAHIHIQGLQLLMYDMHGCTTC